MDPAEQAATKAEILAGARISDLVAIDALDGRKVAVRPLTAVEVAKVQAALLDGQTASGRPNSKPERVSLDLAAVVRGSYEAQVLACLYGLQVDEKWTRPEVDTLGAPVVEEIAAAIDERWHDGQLFEGGDVARSRAERFRSDGGRDADRGVPPGGHPAGGDAS